MRNARTLVLGTGSGRDIASAVLALGDAAPTGGIDLAGFLTPWAWHTFDGQIEQPVNRLGRHATKFLPHRPEEPLASFFEPRLPAAMRSSGLEVDDVFLFSLQFGTVALETALSQLIERSGYDRVLAVDVGGDVLADPQQFGTVLTPLVDFTCLDVLARLPAALPVELAVIAPGACGEIPPDGLARIFATLERGGAVSAVERFSVASPAYERFLAVNHQLERDTAATSHTFQVIVDIATRPAGRYEKEYVKGYAIGESCFRVPFPVVIEAHVQNRIWRLDLRRAKSALARPEFPFACIGEGFARAKAAGLCGTEVDCGPVAVAPQISGPRNTAYLLTPCCHARGRLRADIIRAGLTAWGTNLADPVVLLRRDAVELANSGLECVDAGETLVVTASGDRDRAHRTAEMLGGRHGFGQTADRTGSQCSG